MKNKIILILGILFVVLYLVGCGGGEKARKAKSIVDSPAIHYDRGKTLLDQGKYEDALFEFKQARSLDPKYAPAYEGMAWISLEDGKYIDAMQLADKVINI